jgi:hypothetical protein
MRNLLALLAALLLLFAGVGWYRDWFKVHSQPTSPGHRNVNIDIDTHKIGQDLHRGEQRLQQILESSKDAKGDPAKVPASIDNDPKAGKDSKAGKDGSPRTEATFPADPLARPAHDPLAGTVVGR